MVVDAALRVHTRGLQCDGALDAKGGSVRLSFYRTGGGTAQSVVAGSRALSVPESLFHAAAAAVCINNLPTFEQLWRKR